MNHTELRACVATRPPLSNRGFATEVGAVISTLAAVPAHGEMFAIAGFGNSTIRHRADRRDPAPVKQPPSSLTIDGLQCLHNPSRCGKPVVRKSRMTFVAGRSSRDFWVSSPVRRHAQMRAELESPRVRDPYIARCELPAATPLRSPAHTQYRRRYRSAFAHCSPRSGAQFPSLANEDPGTAHQRHFGHEAPLTEASTTVTMGRFGSLHPRLIREACRRTSRTHRTSTPHHCLPVRFVLTVVVDSLNQLNSRAISGEMTPPSGTRAYDMGSTGTECDSVFAHATPRFGPCAGQPPDDDEPRRTHWGHLTIAAETSPAPASVGLSRSSHPPVSHSLSRPSLTVQPRETRGSRGHPIGPIGSYLGMTTLTTTHFDALRLTPCPLRISACKTVSCAETADHNLYAPSNVRTKPKSAHANLPFCMRVTSSKVMHFNSPIPF